MAMNRVPFQVGFSAAACRERYGSGAQCRAALVASRCAPAFHLATSNGNTSVRAEQLAGDPSGQDPGPLPDRREDRREPAGAAPRDLTLVAGPAQTTARAAHGAVPAVPNTVWPAADTATWRQQRR